MLNRRPYNDEIKFTARRFANDFPAVHVTYSEVFQGSFTSAVSVVIRTSDPEVQHFARVAFQSLGDHCHVEEYEGIDARLDFTWLVE